jgi:hypothetical protein
VHGYGDGGVMDKEILITSIKGLASKGLCARDIAAQVGVTAQTVGNYARKYDIDVQDGRKILAPELTHQYLMEVLQYDHETGVFTRKVQTSNFIEVGQKAGTITSDGYLVVSVAGKQILAHRLVWFYVHGVWPENHIDHINGNRSDNRIANLRDVTNQVNSHNRTAPPKSVSGALGVSYDKRREKFRSRIMVDGVEKWIGSFATAEAAHEAYRIAKTDLHEGFVK